MGKAAACLDVEPIVAQGFEHPDPVGDVLLDPAFFDGGTRTEQRERRQADHAAEQRGLFRADAAAHES